ncbi:MAG: hydantoinase/oxoprolinase family protein [Candidatus Hodarchaeota archaeon]
MSPPILGEEPIRIGIDIGGTFTDVILIDATGHRWHEKVRSTPEDASQGVIEGVKRILEHANVTPNEVDYLLHGTTVATNTVLQRQGATISLIVTKGFEDLLEIGRQQRRALYDLFLERVEPLVQRSKVEGVDERILANGEVHQPLTNSEAQRVIQKAGYHTEAVAVCLLFAYRNPLHEQVLQAHLHKLIPELPISLSSQIIPEYREYERLSTTVLNAYITPVLTRYLRRLETALNAIGIRAPLLVMQSHGGVLQSKLARNHAVRLMFSGLAGGTLGGRYTSQVLDQDHLITFDMGGTSTDVALITQGTVQETSEGQIDGWPCRVPMVDVNTVGAGGGSIAWIDEGQILRVGPKSAGAIPGPAAYAGGGEQATVTDANLILGRLNPDYFLGGEIKLDFKLAHAAITKLADRIALSPIECAYGIIRVVNANMERAIRVVSIQRGYDPRDFSLAAFGGAGPMHAWALAVNLGIPQVDIPFTPGLHSALGLLATELRFDQSQTVLESTENLNVSHLHKTYHELKSQLAGLMRDQGVKKQEIQITYFADLRYQRQAYEITLPVPRIDKTKSWVKKLEQSFHAQHKQRYGFASTSSPVTIVNLRVSATHAMPSLKPTKVPPQGEQNPSPKQVRPVFFEEYNGFVETPVYDRLNLGGGATIFGPAIIEQVDTTTVIHPQTKAVVHSGGNLIMEETS